MPPARRARAPAAAAASARGQTVVCKSGICVAGNYKPFGGKTAHRRLANKVGMESPSIGGAIKADGTIGLNSETINRVKHGKCDMAGTSLGERTKRDLQAGKFMTVKEYNARNQKNGR